MISLEADFQESVVTVGGHIMVELQTRLAYGSEDTQPTSLHQGQLWCWKT